MTRAIQIHRRPERSVASTRPSRSPRPTHPRTFGPRARCVHDMIHQPPTFVYFLNTHVTPALASRLDIVRQECSGCMQRMCDTLHVPSPLPACPPAPPQNTGRIQFILKRAPAKRHFNGPSMPPPLDPCPNDSMCEVAVKITKPGCGHVVGSRCLSFWLLKGHTRCPICRTEWFVKEDVDERAGAEGRLSAMREAWQWRKTKLPVAGKKGWFV